MPNCKDCNSEMEFIKEENGFNVYECPDCLLEEREKKKKKPKKHYFLYLLISIIFLGMFVTATTIITNKDIKYGTNTTLNDTGVYYGNSKAFVRTADVVVCRGTSLADDLWKRFSCDVVCASTDSDCGAKINSTIYTLSQAGGGVIDVGCGFYPIENIYIWGASNVKLLGHGSCSILSLDSSDILLRIPASTNNFEVAYFKFNTTNTGSRTGITAGTTPTNNIYIHDIDFGNINYDAFRVTSDIVTNNYHTNLKLERLILNNASFVLGKINNGFLKSSTFNGASVIRNDLGDIGYSEHESDIVDFLVQGNYFYNKINTTICIASSANVTNLNIDNNYFYCNGTAIDYTLTTPWKLYTSISNNRFFLGDYDSSSAILVRNRGVGYVSVNNNYFIDLYGRASGLTTYVSSDISNNYFYGLGSMGILAKAKSNIIGNTFKDLDKQSNSDRFVYVDSGGSYSKVINNNFESTSAESGTAVRLESAKYLTVEGNTFNNFTGTSVYSFDHGVSGIEYNTSYVDDYEYTNIVGSVLCGTTYMNVTYGKTIHNATAQCTCIAGAWKCLNYY